VSGRGARSPRPLGARALGAAATGALIALWAVFAPASVGGDFSYAVVRGDSMRPHLDNGDVVVLRRERAYGLGDVVAYHDPQIGTVLHRVVERRGDRFVLRGDNRSQLDPYEPVTGDVVGREVAVIPGLLWIVLAVTSPGTVLTVAFAIVALPLAWSALRGARGPRRRRWGRFALEGRDAP
jgi:signal peptidase I